jgi:hypothetical protein
MHVAQKRAAVWATTAQKQRPKARRTNSIERAVLEAFHDGPGTA